MSEKPVVAYFCMEYGLSNDFRIYSGGLGILAGDLIKAAYDADFPMVAIGILWRQGYTSQTIGDNGLPVDSYPEYRYPHLKDTGVTVNVIIKGNDVTCKVWLCDSFGNIPLYLLDTYLPDNREQLLTGQLYGWFEEERVAQEIVLGVGGVRALKALGIKPDIYHFNEGHAVLAGLELINREMEALSGIKGVGGAIGLKEEAGADGAAGSSGVSGVMGVSGAVKPPSRAKLFGEAVGNVREHIVFTTHTPVLAGNESHGYRVMRYIGADLGFSDAELRKIGGEPFNMTVAGLHLARKSNAVAGLHAETANKMWANVKNIKEIVAVTNGVHNGTWQDPGLTSIMNEFEALAADTGETNSAGKLKKIVSAALWAQHTSLKRQMMQLIEMRERVTLDPDRLTIGFARRAAPYKRSDLIFRDVDRIEPLLENGVLQLVFSGKAHPNDQTGKKIVSNLAKMAERYPKHVVYLQNYDMDIGQSLTRGCDVWLNNPVRPQEASGTSGMKAAMNGVLNFSVLDGWWPEGCVHGENGWRIGEGVDGLSEAEADAADTESLYSTLITEIIPIFYDNREKWIDMMINSIKMSREKFSAARMLQDYADKVYSGI